LRCEKEAWTGLCPGKWLSGISINKP
jgi:hypothetical protein